MAETVPGAARGPAVDGGPARRLVEPDLSAVWKSGREAADFEFKSGVHLLVLSPGIKFVDQIRAKWEIYIVSRDLGDWMFLREDSTRFFCL